MDPESFRNFVSELGEAIEWANAANSATDTVEVGMIGMGVIASWSSAGRDVASGEPDSLLVALRSVCHLLFDFGESIATGGKESEVVQESRRGVAPSLAFPEAG